MKQNCKRNADKKDNNRKKDMKNKSLLKNTTWTDGNYGKSIIQTEGTKHVGTINVQVSELIQT